MKIQSASLPRKALWLLLAIFLLVTQVACATELTEEELLAMPAVSITYFIQEGGEALVPGRRADAEPPGQSVLGDAAGGGVFLPDDAHDHRQRKPRPTPSYPRPVKFWLRTSPPWTTRACPR